MKHYMEIERARFETEGLTKSNLGAFNVGDHIVIQEKWDGANCSIRLDDNGNLLAFSRKNELSMSNDLRGFWGYVQALDKNKFQDLGNRILFGEWGIKHTVVYNQDAYNKMYCYDMYDTETETWLPQNIVKEYVESHGLEYIHTFYDGEFISWEHCMQFLNSPGYGNRQEGIVVKNQSKLDDRNCREPFYIKIVNAQFKETKINNHLEKLIDPNNEIEKQTAEEHAKELVTEARVKKEIHKMIDEGLLPEIIEPKDMGTVSKLLPKRIYEDIDKEDHDTLVAYTNKFIGKAITSTVMNYARQIILG